MQAALDALMNAIGAEGAAVIDVGGEAGALLVHRAGGGADEVLAEATALLAAADGPSDAIAKDGRPILVAACRTRFGANAGIALWRSPGSRGWDSEDKLLIGASASLIRMVLEHEAIQQEMARQARTDPLTGLLNRRAFLEEMTRHIDRLDREEQPGTLLFADLDYFKPVNDRLGHEAGDEVLVRTANILRKTVRPSDLVARLGGDEFALWMDGADHMTAAERAEHLCTEVPTRAARDRRRRRTVADDIDRYRDARGRQPGAGGQPAAPGGSRDVRGEAHRPRPLACRDRGAGVINEPIRRVSAEAARVRLAAGAGTEADVLTTWPMTPRSPSARHWRSTPPRRRR